MCLKSFKENKVLRKKRWVRQYHLAVLRVLLAEDSGAASQVCGYACSEIKAGHSNVCDARNSETASLKNVDKLPKIFKIHETLTLMETLERVRPIERKCSISALPDTRALLDSTALEQMQTN